jgi:hypothetical protein
MNNKVTVRVTIDASKVFDVVWHESMLRKLFYTGISKETWILTKISCHTTSKAFDASMKAANKDSLLSRDSAIASVNNRLAQDKPINNPNSYRRITVSSVIGKLFEKVILHKISPLLKESQNPHPDGHLVVHKMD